MSQTINVNYTTTTSSEFREAERLREKARRDEAQALHHAEQKGAAKRNIEIAQNLIKMGMSSEQISAATGLTCEEVEQLSIPV